MKRKTMKWIAVFGLMSAIFLAVAGLVQAGGGEPVAPGFRPGTTLENPQDFGSSMENNPSGSAVMDRESVRLGVWNWLENHGKGLVYGLAEGAVIALGVVAVGALLTVSAPVLAVAAAAAVVGAGLYGLFAGADGFNVWECGLYSLIGAVSAGVGQGLAAAGLAGRGLAAAKAALDVVGSGLAVTGSYLLHTPHPTWGGAAEAFGLGVVTAVVFMGLGAVAGKVAGKVRAALGFGGGGAGGGGSTAVVEGVAQGAERGAVEAEVAVTSEAAVLERLGAGEASEVVAELPQAGRSALTEATQNAGGQLGRIDYSRGFERDLKDFVPGYRLHDGPLEEGLTLVQFHENTPLGEGRSVKWWTTVDEANGMQTLDDIRQKLALPSEWGERDVVAVARISKGTDVTFYMGRAASQKFESGVYAGGGVQLRFKEFDPAWIVEERMMR